MAAAAGPFGALAGISLVATLSTVVMHPASVGYMAYLLERILSGRCPACGYRWEQPIALLTGQECLNDPWKL
jgi:hypothetical protein